MQSHNFFFLPTLLSPCTACWGEPNTSCKRDYQQGLVNGRFTEGSSSDRGYELDRDRMPSRNLGI